VVRGRLRFYSVYPDLDGDSGEQAASEGSGGALVGHHQQFSLQVRGDDDHSTGLCSDHGFESWRRSDPFRLRFVLGQSSDSALLGERDGR
jgi:hypothetical protein